MAHPSTIGQAQAFDLQTSPMPHVFRNCGASVRARYDTASGQKGPVKCIGLREGGNDFGSRVYGLNAVFLLAVRDRTIWPGYATREFSNVNHV